MLEILEEARAESPSVEHVVVAPWDELVADLAGGAPAGRAPVRDAVPPDLHLRDDRHAEGRRPRPGRLPRLDRAGGLLPGGRRAGRRDPLRHRHGLDHGPVDGGRRPRDGLDARLRRRRAGLASRSPLAADRAGARLGPRHLADARPGTDPARRSGDRPLVAPHDRHDRRALEPRAVPLAVRDGRRRPRARSSTAPAGRRSARASSPRRRRSRSRPARSAGPPSGWRWTSWTARAARWWGAARSASSSAASPSPG